jgi:hypothetical protein
MVLGEVADPKKFRLACGCPCFFKLALRDGRFLTAEVRLCQDKREVVIDKLLTRDSEIFREYPVSEQELAPLNGRLKRLLFACGQLNSFQMAPWREWEVKAIQRQSDLQFARRVTQYFQSNGRVLGRADDAADLCLAILRDTHHMQAHTPAMAVLVQMAGIPISSYCYSARSPGLNEPVNRSPALSSGLVSIRSDRVGRLSRSASMGDELEGAIQLRVVKEEGDMVTVEVLRVPYADPDRSTVGGAGSPANDTRRRVPAGPTTTSCSGETEGPIGHCASDCPRMATAVGEGEGAVEDEIAPSRSDSESSATTIGEAEGREVSEVRSSRSDSVPALAWGVAELPNVGEIGQSRGASERVSAMTVGDEAEDPIVGEAGRSRGESERATTVSGPRARVDMVVGAPTVAAGRSADGGGPADRVENSPEPTARRTADGGAAAAPRGYADGEARALSMVPIVRAGDAASPLVEAGQGTSSQALYGSPAPADSFGSPISGRSDDGRDALGPPGAVEKEAMNDVLDEGAAPDATEEEEEGEEDLDAVGAGDTWLDALNRWGQDPDALPKCVLILMMSLLILLVVAAVSPP